MKGTLLIKKQTANKRVFSEEFKRQKVKEIERKLITVVQLTRQYQVSSSAVYKWIYKYSEYLKRGITQVIQMESEQEKTKQLQSRIAELERVVGQKQMKIDYLEKLIELESEDSGQDIKKKGDTILSTGSGSTKKNTAGK